MYSRELASILRDCGNALQHLSNYLLSCGRSDSGSSGPDKIRGEIDKLGGLRVNLISHKTSLTGFLDTILLIQSNRHPTELDTKSETLGTILDKVDAIAARMHQRAGSETLNTYYKQRNWREKLIFRLRRIEFVEVSSESRPVPHKKIAAGTLLKFEACPEHLVDSIIPDKVPPTLAEDDFSPAPPLKRLPPIGPEHMMHLFTNCSSIPTDTTLYLRLVPKKRDRPLEVRLDKLDGNPGWGLHFVEAVNRSLAVTVAFLLSLILGLGFAVAWTVLKKDIQGAFGVAAYVTSVVALAVMTWQMWET